MTGDATRQASFGRLQGAGVIRFGQDYLTSMRLGVGLQVTNSTSTMTTGGVSVVGPGDEFEVDGFEAPACASMPGWANTGSWELGRRLPVDSRRRSGHSRSVFTPDTVGASKARTARSSSGDLLWHDFTIAFGFPTSRIPMDRPRNDDHEELKSIIGRNARAARRELGLTQSEAAEQMDITCEFYARIERGKALPSVFTLVRMGQVLNTSTDRLLGLALNPAKLWA